MSVRVGCRWGSKIFWALWRIVMPLKFFEGVDSPLMFTALFLVSEWMTGYYLAFNFQVRLGCDAFTRASFWRCGFRATHCLAVAGCTLWVTRFSDLFHPQGGVVGVSESLALGLFRFRVFPSRGLHARCRTCPPSAITRWAPRRKT